MVVRTAAAPPTPWSKTLAEPQIDPSAYVHPSANLIGNVTVEANVMLAPGISVRADEGTPFFIGEGTNIQDGVVIHGLEQGKVVGDDGQEYSVWIGKQSCITHMAIVHGPAYVGSNCFIGFRTTVFNARVSDGCIVMMHSLIQDVEIPPGRYVPSGAVITSQQQADRLPSVQESDRAFANHVVEINEALRAGYQCAENTACIAPIREQLKRSNRSVSNGYSKSVETMTVDTQIKEQVRSLLQQGYQIGIEHASPRRFKTKSWLTAGTIDSKREGEALQQLDQMLAEYPGEYVQLIGIDAEQKRRVLETIIQRPDDAPKTRASSERKTPKRSDSPSNGKVQLDSNRGRPGDELQSQVRSLLQQGYQIGIEHASPRRFKTKSWLTAGTIDSKREGEALQQLDQILAEYPGEYVQLIGIDAEQKRRVLETIIQRPDDAPKTHASSNDRYYRAYSSDRSSSASGTGLDEETVSRVRSLLQQGYQIGSEHADKRRFRSQSWSSCSPIESSRESVVLEALKACLAEHQGEYVRMFGIDTKGKRRVSETIIQRPGETAKPPSVETAPPRYNSVTNGATQQMRHYNTNLSPEAVSQVRALLSQGYKIGTEHADKRRFRSQSWSSCSPIESSQETEVLTALEACLAEHQGEYVRMFGIDLQHKRRVSETIIARP